MKIRRKYLPFITAVAMGLSMGVIMSFVMTWVNLGLVEGFLIKWAKAFAVGASYQYAVGCTQLAVSK